MRKIITLATIIVLFTSEIRAQVSSDVIAEVMRAQSKIKNASYKMVRNDTLVTGDIRTITGNVKMRTESSEPNFGFLFSAKENAVNGQILFNGHMAYETDDALQVYRLFMNPSEMKDLLFHTGGRIVMPDLGRLDTTRALSTKLSEDPDFYHLTLYYPDLTQYDVTKRYKRVTIDKQNMLPAAVVQHQETLGKVQNLAWHVQDLIINDKSFHDEFETPGFLKTHTQKIPLVTEKHPLTGLKGKPAPLFELKSFEDKLVSMADRAGEVILLDFWEVWCGPCIESMPKVQQLYSKFKGQGLVVYGIMHDIRQLESAKRFVQRHSEIKFPMLIGNEAVRKNYLLNAVPQYVLIDRRGAVRFVGLGYSDQIEVEIQKALNEK